MRRRIVGIIVGVLIAVVGVLILLTQTRSDAADARFARLTNLGKAYLENREADKAIASFRLAVQRRPRAARAYRNLARAQLRAGKADEALVALTKAQQLTGKESASMASTSYLTGIAYVRLAQYEQALPYLQAAVRLDADSAVTHFQLAGAYEALGRTEQAVAELRETVKRDPLHASAHYKLGTFARRRGDVEAFKKCHKEFMRLRQVFGNESRSGEALEACSHTEVESAEVAVVASAAPWGVRFVDRTQSVVGAALEAIRTVDVIEATEQGGAVLIAVDRDGSLALLHRGAGGAFERQPVDASLPEGFAATDCFAADFYDDLPEGEPYDARVHRRNDVLLLGNDELVLLKRTGVRSFENVTSSAGLDDASGRVARWIDFEHDGDLDLFLGGADGLQVWQNNGDGTFQEVAGAIGAAINAPVVDIAAADFDANVAVDVVVAIDGAAPVLLENQRMGRFARDAARATAWPNATRVLAEEFTGDGRVDLLFAADRSITMVDLATGVACAPGLPSMSTAAVEVMDFDNDGRLDIVAWGTRPRQPDGRAVGLLHNTGASTWVDVSDSLERWSSPWPPIRNAIAADYDLDGDTDLLVVLQRGGLRYLENDGGNANRQLRISLLPVKTNPSSLGTEVEVRAGLFRVTRQVRRPLLEIGIGLRDRVDTLQTLWTNGVVDNLIDVSADRSPLQIVEKIVATGSCPFVYVWDGRTFRFGTDILGNAPVGLSLARGVYLPADPDEFVYLGHESDVRPKDGRFRVQVTEEFREVLYLDHVKIVVVDHPPNTEVHATDKLMPEPFPPSELWTLAGAMTPTRAMGDDGIDRTAALQAIDGRFADPGIRRPPPFRGQVVPMALTLEFESLHPGRPLVLALTGWLQYGDASTNIALSQAGQRIVAPPRLDVQTDDGIWHSVDVVVGMPAGKTKTILVDLENRLPEGARSLRLTTSFEIYWDRIALMSRVVALKTHTYSLAPDAADLKWRGFSELRSRGPLHPTTPDFNVVFPTPPWRGTPQGWCTRYGDVAELIAERDDRIAILNAGDTVEIAFAADSLPPVPPGWVRSFFFYSVGWDKDGDHNVEAGDRVDPWPVPHHYPTPTSMDAPVDHWETQYNTRWVPADLFDRRFE
ncbi:MAG: FG-GAP-like repeat-containing protein [Phycisphaerae bacterium]